MRRDQSTLERFVDRLEAHSPIPKAARDAIFELHVEPRSLRAGGTLLSPGVEMKYVYVINEGLLGLIDCGKSGERQILSFLLAGDFYGADGITGRKNRWEIASFGMTSFIAVSLKRLKTISRSHPAVALALWRHSLTNLDLAAKSVVRLGRPTALEKIGYLLCEIGLRTEKADAGSRCDFNLPLTQFDLGNALGMTNVHVSRLFGELRERGIVRRDGYRVSVLDWERLTELSKFEPSYLMEGNVDNERGG